MVPYRSDFAIRFSNSEHLLTKSCQEEQQIGPYNQPPFDPIGAHNHTLTLHMYRHFSAKIKALLDTSLINNKIKEI
jgi:hypothetical protein